MNQYEIIRLLGEGGMGAVFLARDTKLKERLREIWVAAGLRMSLRRRGGALMNANDLSHSETVPKVCLVSRSNCEAAHINSRYFTPQAPHSSLAVTGGCCLAVACLVPGTVANAVAQGLQPIGELNGICTVAMRNPAGVLRARIGATSTNSRPPAVRIGAGVVISQNDSPRGRIASVIIC